MKKALLTFVMLAGILPVFLSPHGSFAQSARLIGMGQYNGSFNYGTVFSISPDGDEISVLHNFQFPDGAYPSGGLVQASNGLLYGMTSNGGTYGIGTIFRMKSDGTGHVVLHHFDNATGRYNNGSLIQASDGALYGMAYSGGTHGLGTIFRIGLDGLGMTILHHFDGPSGATPIGSLIQGRDGLLYGLSLGGNAGVGVLFRMHTNGTGFTVLHHFTQSVGSVFGSLVQGDDGTLYGFTARNNGTIFRINPDGTGFGVMHFLQTSEGFDPQNSLTRGPEGTLYGMTSRGGIGNHGTIVTIKPDGSGFRVLHYFNGTEGSLAVGNLLVYDNHLYGFTSRGGTHNLGVAFRFSLETETFHKMADFSPSNGGLPWRGSLIVVNPDAIETPAQEANSITFSNVLTTLMTVSFIPGNGSKHLVVMKAGSAPEFVPDDDTMYDSDPGNGERIVYDGAGNSFDITGLAPDTEYFLKVFTYNQDGAQVRYKVDGAPVASRSTQSAMPQLLGMASSGGNSSAGSIFKVTPATNQVAQLYSFKQLTGGYPMGGLIQGEDEWLYGVTQKGSGSAKYGTVFRVSPEGKEYTVLHNFTLDEGAYPVRTLRQGADGRLYGVTQYEGPSGFGTLFGINTDGTGFAILHDFGIAEYGRFPQGQLLQLTDGTLYGLTGSGGMYGFGTIYRINPDGSGLAPVYHFTDGHQRHNTGSLIQGADGFLYGVTQGSGSASPGMVYKVRPDGTGFTALHTFTTLLAGVPSGSLVQAADGWLYGTTIGDATGTAPHGFGTIYRINYDGTGYDVLHYFDGPNGYLAKGSLTLYGNRLYGFTTRGGASNGGVVFYYDLATSGYVKIKELDKSTGQNPWFGDLLMIDGPEGEANYIVSPSQHEHDLPLNISVRANEVPMATMYTIELNTDPGFGESTAMVKTGGRTIPFHNLALGTIYYARVKTDVRPFWGPTRQFTTGNMQTLAFVTDPANNKQNVSWEPLVKVNAIPGAATYFIQLSTENTFPPANRIEMSANTTLFQFTGLAVNTQYYSRVTTDLSPATWGPVRSFVTGTAQGLTFVTHPKNGAIGVHPIANVTANTVPGATMYTIQLSTDESFTGPIIEETGTTPALSFNGLSYNTTYYNRVKTDQATDFGEVRRFTTGSPEMWAHVTTPPNGGTNIKTEKLSVVSKPVPYATTYTIQLSEDPGFSTIAFEATASERSVIFSGLKFNTTYYNRVQTDLTTEFGAIHSFTTREAPVSAMGGIEATLREVGSGTILSAFAVDVYPNPFLNELTVFVSSAESLPASVVMIDVKGQTVARASGDANTGIVLESTVPPGVYLLKVQSGTNTKILRVVKTE